MPDPVEQLIDSLLYEGYALYPYTPGAAKNATPTPFGIVYPPNYAAGLASTFDHLELRCVLEAPRDARIGAEVRFLAATGERHEAVAQRLELADTSVGALEGSSPGAGRSLSREAEVGVGDAGRLLVTLILHAQELDAGIHELALRIANRTPCAHGLDRAGALARSLLSTHPILRVSGGRFISPLERPCASVNTFPVLASDTDDALIGGAIVLPEHPQIAPESRGGLFDSTEIEEALLLHVKVLSEAERTEIERQDPVVREMVARAAAATPEDILALHGRVTMRDPARAGARSPVTETPPEEPPELVDPTAGEEYADVDGVRFRRSGKVRIRPGPDADLHARMLDGRIATIERVMVDYDGKVHLGVTIDGDPGQELLRDSGRFLYFFAPEVEALQSPVPETGGSDER
ncbi:MAG TPA: hypothetical protein VGW98_10760 [Solirubrobacteraceae bacterium]|jgi:hypothetical protein|nr:hypothetical protein [Solirubrobacteraceae bacterium]